MSVERMEVKVAVEDDHVLLVFPRPLDDFKCPWQDADNLGLVLIAASKDVPQQPLVVDPITFRQETEQVKIGSHKGHVVLLFAHTDRIKFGPTAAIAVGQAIRVKAQDLQLETKKVRITYDKNGHPVPNWTHSRRNFPVR